MPFDHHAYAERNPGWHALDASAKAAGLDAVWADLSVDRVVDVGCGTGHVSAALRALRSARGQTPLSWACWDPVDLGPSPDPAIGRQVGDWFSSVDGANLVLLVDVIEHVPDPEALLRATAARSTYLLLRVPLELSVWDVLRPKRRLAAREQYGHRFAWDLPAVLDLVAAAGWIVLRRRYDRVPPRLETVPQKLVDVIRRVPNDPVVRWLGGWSVVMLMERNRPG